MAVFGAGDLISTARVIRPFSSRIIPSGEIQNQSTSVRDTNPTFSIFSPYTFFTTSSMSFPRSIQKLVYTSGSGASFSAMSSYIRFMRFLRLASVSLPFFPYVGNASPSRVPVIFPARSASHSAVHCSAVEIFIFVCIFKIFVKIKTSFRMFLIRHDFFCTQREHHASVRHNFHLFFLLLF